MDQGSNEKQSRNKSNMNPNESFVRITGPTIYELNMKKLAKSLMVQINSCSRIHSHTHTPYIIGLDTLCIFQQQYKVFMISWRFAHSVTSSRLIHMVTSLILNLVSSYPEGKGHQKGKAWLQLTSTSNGST